MTWTPRLLLALGVLLSLLLAVAIVKRLFR